MGFGKPISLGRLFGVYIRIDISLFLLAAFFMLDGLRVDGLRGVVNELTFVTLLFLCVFLHECGHALAAYAFGIRTLDVTLSFFGGVARLAKPARRPIEDAIIAFAGPAVNLAIAAILYYVIQPESFILRNLTIANLLLAVFNLLPGYPLDGGTIARAILTNFMPRNRARVIVGYIGVGVGLLLVAWGLRGGSFSMLLGFLLIYLASMEIQAARASRF